RLTAADVPAIRAAYDTEYSRFYDRPVPGSDVEIMSYAVAVATDADDPPASAMAPQASAPAPSRSQRVRDSVTGAEADWAVYDRAALAPGATLAGPAIIAEDETSTLVGIGWTAHVTAQGYIELVR